jgi:linoleoyl-CoA desaturase
MKHFKFTQSINTPFYVDLKQRVDAYFKSKSNNRKANAHMYTKMIFIFALFCSSYGLLVSNVLGPWLMFAALVVFGLSNVLVAFNIAHDASHGALFKKNKWNKLFAYTFNLIGVNQYIWDIKHNQSHHAFTNIEGLDIDIEQTKIARIHESSERKWFHRYQHLYLPFIYPLASLFMIFIKDFQLFAAKRYGNKVILTHPRKERVILFLSKFLYITYTLIIPMIVINLIWWKILIGFIMMHLIMGVFLSIILFPAHVLDDSPFPKPDDSMEIHNSWAVHQVETTTNFAANNRFITWLSGGLNTHIAHHLYPNICHIYYYDLTKIIREVAQKHQISFRDKTMLGALKSHLAYFKQMGKGMSS